MMTKRAHLFRAALLLACAQLSGCTWWALQAPAADTVDLATGEESALDAYLATRAGEGPGEASSAYVPWVAVYPFEDDSGFRRGVFDLPRDVPRMLAHMLQARDVCRVVPPAAVEELVAGRGYLWAEEHLTALGDTLRADYVITGALLDYNFERLHVGDPLLGGYKSFVGTAEMEVELRGGAQFGLVGTAHSRKEAQNRGLGLDLLGKPREGDRQFANLEHLEYGGEEFRATALGEATVQAMDQIILQIARLLQPQELSGLEAAPRVLSVFGSEIFISVGNDHGVKQGYRFRVRTGVGDRASARRGGESPVEEGVPSPVEGGVPSPVVEVEDVISASVSRVVALRGGDRILPGQTLELIGAGDGSH